MHLHEIKRREFLAALSAPLFISGSPSSQNENISVLFDQAVNNEKLRQLCVNVVTKLFSSRYLDRADYSVPSEYKLFGNTRDNFASGQKSHIEIYPRNFYPNRITIGERIIEIPPSMDILVTTLLHEYSHAQDNFSGWDFGNDLVVDSKNIGNVDKELRNFIGQSKAGLAEIAYTSNLPKQGLYNPVHALSTHYVLDLVNASMKIFKEKKFSDFDQSMLEFQLSNLAKVRDDITETLSLASRGKIEMKLEL